MTWQTNLFNNLLVLGILTSLGVAVYCNIKKITLTELIKSIKETMKDE